MIVEPFPPKHRYEDLGDSIRLTIPSKKNRFRMAAYSAILIVWGGIDILMGVLAIMAYPDTVIIVPLTLFILLALICTPMCLALLWQWIGVEVIKISDQTVSIQKRIGKLGPQRVYRTEPILFFRVASQPVDFYPSQFIPGGLFLAISDGWITFDYGARTIRFGSGIDEAEARMIFAKIMDKFPQYNNLSGSGITSLTEPKQ